MKSIEERKSALLELKPCPQGLFCTTGCTHAYAQSLIKSDFSIFEMEEALRLMKRTKEISTDEAEYVEFILKLMNEMSFANMNSEIKKGMNELINLLEKEEIKFLTDKSVHRKYSPGSLPVRPLHRDEIIQRHNLNQAVSYFDLLAATGFKKLADLDLCFFIKSPNTMSLEEFRYFLMYSIGDENYASYFRDKIAKEFPELNGIYAYVHQGVLIDSYAELIPLLEQFKIDLAEKEFFQ